MHYVTFASRVGVHQDRFGDSGQDVILICKIHL